MKIRYGHVSNSSSSSFVITLPTPLGYPQFYTERLIQTFEEMINKGMETVPVENQWLIERDHNKITCSTHIDSFDLYRYVTEELGIDESIIEMRVY